MKTLFCTFFALFAAVSFAGFAADSKFDKDDITSVRAYAEQGNPEAQYYLGLFYEIGKDVEKDMAEAAKWYRKAADQNDLDAQYKLGLCYDKGEGVPHDGKEAVKWYTKAAEGGIIEAQINLGICYETGNGIVKNITEAVKWYRMAADRKNPEAQYKLGYCYETHGEIRSDDKAAIWYRRAAERGNAEAQYKIGLFYETGKGVEKNMKEAGHWYAKAADQGNPDAQFSLGRCYEKGEGGVPRDMAVAVKWYRKALNHGYRSPFDLYMLGKRFEEGRDGLPKDLQEAAYWYRMAAEQGHSEAKTKLEFLGKVLNTLTENADKNKPTAEDAERKAREEAERKALVEQMSGEKMTITFPDSSKLEMIKVAAGTFEMSAGDGENDGDEVPHLVTLKHDFYIGRTEVTQTQWKSVMRNNPSDFKGDDLPVENVSWNDAMAFCEKLNAIGKAPSGWKFTLPTETQWEFAARGGKKSKGYKYSGSSNFNEVAWYCDNSRGKTHPVGQKKANELGLYDMSGNVDEWCLDDWNANSSKQKAEFTRGNDRGGSNRLYRGGSWYYLAMGCRSADRSYFGPGNRRNILGFRVALVPTKY